MLCNLQVERGPTIALSEKRGNTAEHMQTLQEGPAMWLVTNMETALRHCYPMLGVLSNMLHSTASYVHFRKRCEN
jgi:hypothetical protein